MMNLQVEVDGIFRGEGRKERERAGVGFIRPAEGGKVGAEDTGSQEQCAAK